MIAPLPDVLLAPYVDAALAEDLGRRGDVTSLATISEDQQATLHVIAREDGIVAGMDLARLAWLRFDENICYTPHVKDGDTMTPSMCLATVTGAARALLAAERTALNFMTHLSGIATQVNNIVMMVKDEKAQITCTRKTLPGLRTLQKYAVRVGGGRNHRMGLDDAILIKDNHIAIAGSLTKAIMDAKAYAGHLIPIEVEVDTLTQLKEALAAGVHLVLLDNMDTATLTQAVRLCEGKCQTEASGGITQANVLNVAKTGVDFIAIGALTHSVRSVDIGLDFIPKAP